MDVQIKTQEEIYNHNLAIRTNIEKSINGSVFENLQHFKSPAEFAEIAKVSDVYSPEGWNKLRVDLQKSQEIEEWPADVIEKAKTYFSGAKIHNIVLDNGKQIEVIAVPKMVEETATVIE